MTLFRSDDEKAEANWRKHGVTFKEAEDVFDDPSAVFELNRIVDEEVRWQVIGMTKLGMLLIVIHTVQENGEETIRIISARRADPQERRKYER